MAVDTSVTIRLRDRFSDGIKRMRGGLGRLRKDFEKARGSFDMAGQLSLAADGMQKLSQGARNLVEAPIRQAVEFEKQVASLGALTGATGEDLETLRNRARELGRETQFGASEAVEGMQNLARAGLNHKEILDTIGPSLDLAVAGQLDLASTADIATNVMAGLGLATSETRRTMDVLSLAANSSNTNVQGIGETMKFVAPIAKNAGISLEETASAAGVLANNAIKGSQGGTALRAMITRLQAPSKAGKKALRELGVEVEDAHGNIRPFTNILSDLSTGLADVSGAQRQSMLKDMFETEALSAANILVDAAGAGDLQNLTATLQGAQGSARRFADTMANTTSGKMKAMQSRIEDLQIEIGTELIPVLLELMETVKPMIEDFAAWARENPDLLRQVGKLVIGFGAVTAVLAPLLLTLSGVSGAIGVFRVALVGASGLKAGLSAATAAVSGASGLTGALGKAGLVGAAGAAGYALGSLVREMFNTDEAIASAIDSIRTNVLGLEAGIQQAIPETDKRGLQSGRRVYADGTVIENGRVTKLGEGNESLAPGSVRSAREQGATSVAEINAFLNRRRAEREKRGKLEVEVKVDGVGNPRVTRTRAAGDAGVDVDAGPAPAGAF